VSGVRLDPADLEQLAALVVGGLVDPLADALATRLGGVAVPAAEEPLVTAARLAEMLGVSPAWVREHADELGAVRIGNGSRPRLRFDVGRATEAFTRSTTRECSRGSQDLERPGAERRTGRRRRVPAGRVPEPLAIPAWEE
jgi:hypothetical protein